MPDVVASAAMWKSKSFNTGCEFRLYADGTGWITACNENVLQIAVPLDVAQVAQLRVAINAKK